MNVYLKYNIEKLCRSVLHDKLSGTGISYNLNPDGSVSFPLGICRDKYQQLLEDLKNFGIEIIDDYKAILVQKVKSLITDILYKNNALPTLKISAYLADTLNENYRTLANVFTEMCHISIESFIIFHKIEFVKKLLLQEGLSLTEISYRLQYSSVAHLSNQFKNMTGLTPSAFQKLSINRRSLRAVLN
ncbi:AraC family transcriptional regulator [Flavobacterium zepuense]|uniref:AraC family transcriptional regulator n=1 Tax=Flavobacterium zepuense TaxID=2593302 RepID=A0A552V9P1_9FLAO|nr:helix-turn-helix domain-containing protein [Flavobacterium zepuense]TRW27188.1 AraC family transcriptional regulator [Flavobacterium zepuense]